MNSFQSSSELEHLQPRIGSAGAREKGKFHNGEAELVLYYIMPYSLRTVHVLLRAHILGQCHPAARNTASLCVKSCVCSMNAKPITPSFVQGNVILFLAMEQQSST